MLFDQGTPLPLRKHLAGHDVSTAFELNWSALKNGALIAQAEQAGFDPMSHGGLLRRLSEARILSALHRVKTRVRT